MGATSAAEALCAARKMTYIFKSAFGPACPEAPAGGAALPGPIGLIC